MSDNELYEFRDISTLVTALKIALAVYIALNIAGIWSSWLQLDLIGIAEAGDGIPAEIAEANDLREMVLTYLNVGCFLATGALFLYWTYLSNRNAHALGARHMEFSPGWAVGWYFVPFANLWQPYKALKETFQASNPSESANWHHAETPGFLPVWWGLWIISWFMGRATSRSSSSDLAHLLDATRFSIYTDAAAIGVSVVALFVVSTLHQWQIEKHELVAEELEAETFGGPW